MQIFAPSVDVIDRDDEVVVKAEVPGVKKEDIHISLTGNLMTIKGELHDGMLEITLPKMEQAKKRDVKIQEAETAVEAGDGAVPSPLV